MKGREPWLGLATIAGLGILLLGEGAIDALGLGLAAVPLAYGLAKWRAGTKRASAWLSR